MADPEDLALERALPAGHDEAELAELAVEGLPLQVFGDPGSGDGVRSEVRIGQELEAEGLKSGSDGGANGGVALPDVLEAFLLHQVEGGVELEHDRHCGSPGRLAGFGARLVSGEVEVELGHLRRRGGFPGARRDGHERKPGRDHPGLLRAADDDVEAPRVGLERDRAEAADGVYEDERVGRFVLDRGGEDGDRVGDGGGGLVLRHQDGLPRAAGLDGLANLCRIRGLAPLEGELGDVGAVDGGDLGEPVAERADA